MTADWRPRHPPRPSDPVAAFPAPFVPDLARGLRRRGWTFLDTEPAYARLPAAEAARYGYGLGSFRTGPVTAARARAWIEAATGIPPAESFAERDGRWFDLLRPDIEPGGFRSIREAEALRSVTVAAVRRALTAAHTLVLGIEAPDHVDAPSPGRAGDGAAQWPIDDASAEHVAAAAAALRRLGRAQLVLVPVGAVDLGALAALPDVEVAPHFGGEALAAALAGAARVTDLHRPAPSGASR